ncbi:MAG: InlB B-repeat-containing protein, partial [Treponema sp.]|nr:InlB B-repeat-containing protein [Treponema sp.]
WPHSLAGDLTLYAHWRSEEDTEIDQYTIDFESYGGSDVETITADKGTSIMEPTKPVKEGYVFTGWYSDVQGGELYSWPLELAGELILYARWRAEGEAGAQQYTLTFNSREGTEVEAVTADLETGVQKPADPVRSGYTFLGWYSETKGGELYEWPHTLTGDLTLYAQWQTSGGDGPAIKSYTITFDSHGGSELSAVSGSAGTLIEEPAEPSLEGYIFMGWSTEPEYGELYEWPHTLSGNLTMYAQWEAITYTVEYNANGGTGSTASTSHMYDVESPLAQNGFTGEESYYKFAGWNTQADGSGVNYSAGQPVINLANVSWQTVTLYARWVDITKDVYTISFDSNGGSAAEAISANGNTLVGKPADPTRIGYTFQGWYSEEDGGELYEWPYQVTAGVTMYARWTVFSYEISYNLDGGSNTSENPVSYTIESPGINLADPSRAGYTFGGWYANAGFSGNAVTVIPQGSTGNKIFYAKWAAVSYTVTLELAGGTSGSVVVTAVFGSAMPTGNSVSAPVKAHYKFMGYYDSATEGVQYYTEAMASARSWDKPDMGVLYAYWTPNSYTITYSLNGGTNAGGNPASYTFESAAITLADPSRTGYTFGGWYDNAAFTGNAVAVIPQKSAGNRTFWAKWTGIQYKVLFYSNGGTGGSNEVTAVFGSAMPTGNSVSAPARAHYNFMGYYDSATEGVQYYTEGMASARSWDKPDIDVLYAQWTLTPYTITYNLNGGSNPKGAAGSYTFGSTFTLPVPSKAGHEFDGWYGNEDFTGEPVAYIAADSWGNKNLWAKWTAFYTVTYDNNNGSGSINKSIHRIGELNNLAANGFTRPDHIFAGWSTKPEGDGYDYKAGVSVPELTTSPGAAITLYARWLPADRTIDLSDPSRVIGTRYFWRGPMIVRWEFFPERKEYVIYSGEVLQSEDAVAANYIMDEPIYVTGRTTENYIRVVPGKTGNNWAKVPNYTDTSIFNYDQWYNRPNGSGWKWGKSNIYVRGYKPGDKLPHNYSLGKRYEANWNRIRIIFVNAEIELPGETRPPLDIGPYHDEWGMPGVYEEDFFDSRRGIYEPNDHEVDAILEFEGENKLYTPTWFGITLWDSHADGMQYMNEIPWQPDSDGYNSWQSVDNKHHWMIYAEKAMLFATKWGWPDAYPGVRANLNALGWGPSSLTVKFRGGNSSLTASIRDGAGGFEKLSGADIELPDSTPEFSSWAYRMRQGFRQPWIDYDAERAKLKWYYEGSRYYHGDVFAPRGTAW